MTEGPSPYDPVILEHAVAVLCALPVETVAQGDPFELCAAVNAYVHLKVTRKHKTTAGSGAEVLTKGEGVCGSMVLAARELLEAMGVDCELAYTLGGPVAHSMIEAEVDGGGALIDPYHGVIYCDPSGERPLSLEETIEAAGQGRQVARFVRRAAAPDLLAREVVYSSGDEDDRQDYRFPDDYLGLDGYGLAGSGFADFVDVEIPLGRTLGNPDWATPSPDEPTPYFALASERKPDGSHLSWAFILGQTGMGYNVQHLYRVTGLTPGSRFTLKLFVATAYGTPDRPPVVTLRQVEGGSTLARRRLLHASYKDTDGGGGLQVIEATFIAEAERASIVTHAQGDFVLNALSATPA